MVNIFSLENSSQESRGFSHERFNKENGGIDTNSVQNALNEAKTYADESFMRREGISSANNTIFIYDDAFKAGGADYKQWLKNNPLVIEGLLKNPVITELTVSQVNEILDKIETYYPTTHISNDYDVDMEVHYFADSGIGEYNKIMERKITDLSSIIKDLQDRLTALETV